MLKYTHTPHIHTYIYLYVEKERENRLQKLRLLRIMPRLAVGLAQTHRNRDLRLTNLSHKPSDLTPSLNIHLRLLETYLKIITMHPKS